MESGEGKGGSDSKLSYCDVRQEEGANDSYMTHGGVLFSLVSLEIVIASVGCRTTRVRASKPVGKGLMLLGSKVSLQVLEVLE